MDFNAITWAGNIYQKLEAMCLEVEEVMYQDTVKYMENQVQKVGVTVKKFYSEVMQDMLPPSSADPAKVAAEDLSLKKPKLLLQDSPKEKIETGDEAISELTSEKSPPLSGHNDVNQLPPPSTGVPVQSASTDSFSAKSNRLGVNKRPIGIKRISRLDRPSKVSSPTTSLTQLGGGNIDSVERRDLEEVIENTALDTSNDCPVPDKIMPAESVGQLKNEFLGSSIATNSFDVEPIGELDAICDEGKTNQDPSSLETSGDSWDVPFEVQEAAISDKDDFDLEDVENLQFAGSVIEISDTFERSNLAESCVLVDGNNLDSVLQGAKKQKSYKKKLRDALSSKLRRARTQRYRDLRGKMNTEVISPAAMAESGREGLPITDSLESEWELL